MTTNLPNPHYSPEICVKVTLLNFSITRLGLKDQMQALVVSLEKFELESERNSLIELSTENERILIELENQILEELKNSDPEKILDDDEMIIKLGTTKEESSRIKKDQRQAHERDILISKERDY